MMSGPAGRRAIVIGGSMSGLFAGLQLRKAGFTVDVYERAEGELAGRGAGIVAQPPVITALRLLGIDPVDLGVEATTRKVLDVEGRTVCEFRCPQTLTAWERLYRLLRDAFPAAHYHRGVGLKHFEQDARAVTAHFTDGRSVEADLLVAADGIRPTVRQQLIPDLAPLYAGYVAWRSLIPESALPPAIHRELFEYMVFCLPPGEQFLSYPVAGPDNDLRRGHRRYNFVWYRPASEARELRHLLTDDSGRTHMLSIPPPLIARAVIAEMREAAARVLAPQFNQMVSLCEQPFLQPIYDLEVPRMAFGRVALVGDAAFVARPHIGAGVAKAADDALALADVLAGNTVESALRRFQAARLPVGAKIIARTRHLGAYVQADLKSDAEREYAARHRTPEAVLAETAMMEF
jgi:2-polyprenyl-6-methoxyphenol hydroxylase-like FAD-dependent oxidoreductase